MEFINTTLLLAPIFLLSFILTVKKFKNKKEGNKEAPGPWNLPFLGSLHCMLRSTLPHHTFRNLAAVHGPVMNLKLGEIRTVIISSAEAAREITKTRDIVFANRPVSNAAETLFYGTKSLIFSPYGEYWREIRRICSTELLSAKRVRSFRAVREEEVSHLVQFFADSGGSAVNLSSKLAEISNNVAARAIIGGRCDDQRLFFSAVRSTVELMTGLAVVDIFPSLPFIGRITGFQQRLEQCRKKLDVMTEKIVEEHREKMAKNSIDGINDELLQEEDIIDVLLKIQQEEGRKIPLGNDNVKAIVNDMLMSASETTTTIMEWVMSELIQNPSIMKKAQSEIREALGRINTLDKLVNEEFVVNKLTYLQMVIKETLRLHPPVPLLLPRENQKSCEIMGYRIPAKTTVIINMWAIARDPKYWNDPNIFRPERFEDNSLDFKGTHFEFIPFGAGRRMCPGIQFGLATVEIILGYLLYYFDWGYFGNKLDMGETFGVTIRRETPLCVIPTLQFPLHPSTM